MYVYFIFYIDYSTVIYYLKYIFISIIIFILQYSQHSQYSVQLMLFPKFQYSITNYLHFYA